MPTNLYIGQIENKNDDLMTKVWSPTPFMVDVYTDSVDSDRFRSIMKWCRDNFGPESWPIHGRSGDWHSGGVTLYGHTWMGFKTEDMMNNFLEVFPVIHRAERIDNIPGYRNR